MLEKPCNMFFSVSSKISSFSLFYRVLLDAVFHLIFLYCQNKAASYLR
jgi:hypothetical protein